MATIPLVVRVDNLDARTTTQSAFLKSPVRLGRSELNDLPLQELFVSQWHGVVQFDDNQVTYVDLGSTNGTQCDGMRLARNVPVEVTPNTELRIGSLRLVFSRRSVGQRPVAPRPPTQFALHASAAGVAQARDGQPEPGPVPVAAPPAAQLPDEPAPYAPVPYEPMPAYEPAPAYEPPPPFIQELEPAEQAVNNAADQLGADYAAYHESWQRLQDSMQALTSSLDEGLRDRAVALLRERYPSLGGGGEGGAPAGLTLVAAAPMAEPANSLGATALKLVQAFAESYLPMAQAISTPQAVESFLGRIAELIESYSKSFVELRKGYNEFGKEMGIRTVHGDTPIHRARDHRQVLAYLLEGRDDGGRIQDLQAAFADIMIHHVALLNGIMEGAREMLGRLSPDEIVAEATQQPFQPWPPSAWPIGKGRFWNTYVGRHHEIADEESSISQVLFGKEFARAYSAVVGQRGAAPEPPDEDEPTSRRSLPRNSAGPRTSHGR